MKHKKKRYKKISRTKKLSVRLSPEHYKLLQQAAKNEGLQISSYIILMLVREYVFPKECMDDLKRESVPFFAEAHKLYGIVNKIGGNCKQLLTAMPDIVGVRATHASLQAASDSLADAVMGKPIPVSFHFKEFTADITKIGNDFNHIVHSVNMGRPQLSDLPDVLAALCDNAEAITLALTGNPAAHGEMAYVKDIANEAMEEMRANMRKAAAKQTKKNKGDA